MKTILIPTDFSANSLNATRYGFQVALEFGATVDLLHVYHIKSRPHFTNIDAIVELEKKAQHAALISLNSFLCKVLETFEPETSDKLQVKSFVRLGFAIEEIIELAERGNYDLVVMGTKGASNFSDVVLGTNTAAVFDNVINPVLAVPGGAEYKGIHDITYASILDRKSLKPFESVLEFANHYNAKITVLHHKHLKKEDEFHEIETFYKDKNIDIVHIDGQHVSKDIENYVENGRCDILALPTRDRNFYERLFGKELATQICLDIDIPMLAVHFVN